MTRFSKFFRIFVPKMIKLNRFFTRTLSFRLSLRVLIALTTLLMVALMVMFGFSRAAVKEEALQKATQTLEATVQDIDNILFSVEQSTGNVYFKILSHLQQPERVELYRRRLIESNPYISNCTIALESVDEEWYTNTVETGLINWTDPRKVGDDKEESVTTFCLPIYAGSKVAGVMAVDVPLTLLSKIVLENKPSPHSFCALIDRNGSYVIHSDTARLKHESVFSESYGYIPPSVKKAAQAMMAGETGYKRYSLEGKDYYVFYKPFELTGVEGLSVKKLGWSAGIIYPENDILGDYKLLLHTVLLIAFVGLLLMMLLCQAYIHRQLLPLRMLSESAQRIAEGYYDEPIPDTRQEDEVGRMQRHFQEMQQSLSIRMGEMEQLTATLEERGKVLQKAYEQAQEADRMKTNFLYNMTNQMTTPVGNIYKNVKTISSRYNSLTEEETGALAKNIQHDGEKITALLNQLIKDSERSEK